MPTAKKAPRLDDGAERDHDAAIGRSQFSHVNGFLVQIFGLDKPGDKDIRIEYGYLTEKVNLAFRYSVGRHLYKF
jgi:hypothetical protein